ncbi:VanZ family protein [Sporosarcina sp. NPDC096371]|uniref:VanZ family protein n=1 Tax=Sporosarcina sp. NPDC096371 TaxID=3364530 RepID=UPI00381AF744
MKKFILLIILLGVLLGGLFFSSGQTYEQQTLVPSMEKWLQGNKPFESALSTLQVQYWGKTISVEERGYYHFVEFLLRKSAHFFIFGFIAATIYLVLPKHRIRFFTAAGITLLLAAGDEYHQSLTGGRTPTLQDVALDMSGAITFLVLLWVVLWVRQSWKKRVSRK